jgi:hypothetical protein
MNLNRVPSQVHLMFQQYNTNLACNLFAILDLGQMPPPEVFT